LLAFFSLNPILLTTFAKTNIAVMEKRIVIGREREMTELKRSLESLL
jgi:hypothetical protein